MHAIAIVILSIWTSVCLSHCIKFVNLVNFSMKYRASKFSHDAHTDDSLKTYPYMPSAPNSGRRIRIKPQLNTKVSNLVSDLA